MVGVWHKWNIPWIILFLPWTQIPIRNGPPFLPLHISYKLLPEQVQILACLDLEGLNIPMGSQRCRHYEKQEKRKSLWYFSWNNMKTKKAHPFGSKCIIGMKCWGKWYKNTLNIKWNLDQKKNTVWYYHGKCHVYLGRNVQSSQTKTEIWFCWTFLQHHHRRAFYCG